MNMYSKPHVYFTIYDHYLKTKCPHRAINYIIKDLMLKMKT